MGACLILRISLLSLGMLLLSGDVSGKAACTSDADCEKSCKHLINSVYGVEGVKAFASYTATHGKCVVPPSDEFDSPGYKKPSQCECYNKNEDNLAIFHGDLNPHFMETLPACSADAECNSRCEHLVLVHDASVKGNFAGKSKCVSPRCVCYNLSGQELAYFEAS